MRAIRFKAFGDPSVLELAEVADPAVDETTALVRVMAASQARRVPRSFPALLSVELAV